MIVIRRFQPSDVFTVVKLASETLTETYTPSLFNFFYESCQDSFLVAEKQHKVIGFAVGIQTTIDKGRLLMLAVSKQNRNKGIGSKLLSKIIQILKTKGMKILELEVRTADAAVVNFYKNRGFFISTTIPIFYQDKQDAYLMTKLL